MRILEHVTGIIAFGLLVTSIYQIFDLGIYGPMELFIMGLGFAIFNSMIKNVNDSNARDKFLDKERLTK